MLLQGELDLAVMAQPEPFSERLESYGQKLVTA
jgi:hypothetical protein